MPQLADSSDPLLPEPATAEIDNHQPTAPLANMGMSLSTARVAAPTAFLCVSPSLKDLRVSADRMKE